MNRTVLKFAANWIVDQWKEGDEKQTLYLRGARDIVFALARHFNHKFKDEMFNNYMRRRMADKYPRISLRTLLEVSKLDQRD